MSTSPVDGTPRRTLTLSGLPLKYFGTSSGPTRSVCQLVKSGTFSRCGTGMGAQPRPIKSRARSIGSVAMLASVMKPCGDRDGCRMLDERPDDPGKPQEGAGLHELADAP